MHNEVADNQTVVELAMWAKAIFGMTAKHPAGEDENGPWKHLWAPPEGTATPPLEEENPLVKLLGDVADSQESLLENNLLLCNNKHA